MFEKSERNSNKRIMSFPALGHFYRRLLLLLPFAIKTFNYDDPSQWSAGCPSCLGFRQSPIAINSQKAIPIDLPPILFGLYDVFFAECITVHNNGHTCEFEVPTTVLGEKPFITGGLLIDIYEAQSVHFHWGSPQHKGSEHVLNGRRYDLEMHILHRNTKYKTLEMAREQSDGLAVVAVLFKVVRLPHLYTPGLSELYGALLHIGNFNSSYRPTELLTLGSFLGQIDRDDFYTYKGSLTTPPCSETVTWHVFPEVVPISYLKLRKFWQLKDQRSKPILNNFRPLQSSEHRAVFHRQPSDYTDLL